MKTPISPKVVAFFLVVVVVYGVVNVLRFLQTPDGIALYAHLPVLLVLFIKGLVPPAFGLLAGHLKTDPLRISEADLPDPVGYEPRHAAPDEGDVVYADGAHEPVDEVADPAPADYRPGA